jgi:hypothetical protein
MFLRCPWLTSRFTINLPDTFLKLNCHTIPYLLLQSKKAGIFIASVGFVSVIAVEVVMKSLTSS